MLCVTKGQVFWAIVVTEAAGYIWLHVAGLLLGGLIWGLLWIGSCRKNPRIPHGSCGGSGRVRGRIFGWASHRDQKCAGRGTWVRLGARMFGTDDHRAEHAAMKVARQKENFKP